MEGVLLPLCQLYMYSAWSFRRKFVFIKHWFCQSCYMHPWTWTSLASDMSAIESFHMKCQRRILGVRWHDLVCNSEVSLCTGLAPVSDRITRGRNAIFGHVARLPVNTPAHQAKSSYRSVDPQTLHGNVHQVDPIPNGPANSSTITTMFPLWLRGGKPLVAVTRERRYGPSRLRVNDDDDNNACT